MIKFRMLLVLSLLFVSLSAFAQDGMKKGDAEWTKLEKVLWDADQQWLCSSGEGLYHNDIKDCVEFRSKYWADQFFEITLNLVFRRVQLKHEIADRNLAAGLNDVKQLTLRGDAADVARFRLALEYKIDAAGDQRNHDAGSENAAEDRAG